jgi:hypothetical protein
MARTLLDIVQGILSKLDSDTVNSISDTVEADQIADIVKQTYYDIIDEYQLPGQRVISNLEGLSNLTKPNVLKIPDNTQALLTWQYDVRENDQDALRYSPVEYMQPSAFLKMVNQRDSADTDHYLVVEVATNVPIIVDITCGPRYWTSFDDVHIVTDNVNQQVDSTLQASKTQAWIERRAAFLKEDDFVVALPQNLESLLYRTAEGEAYAVFKQAVNPKLEQKERHLRIRAQRHKHRTQQTENNTIFGSPNYGRK